MEINIDLIVEFILLGLIAVIGFAAKALLSRVKGLELAKSDLVTRIATIETNAGNAQALIEEKIQNVTQLTSEKLDKQKDDTDRSLKHADAQFKRIGDMEVTIASIKTKLDAIEKLVRQLVNASKPTEDGGY